MRTSRLRVTSVSAAVVNLDQLQQGLVKLVAPLRLFLVRMKACLPAGGSGIERRQQGRRRVTGKEPRPLLFQSLKIQVGRPKKWGWYPVQLLVITASGPRRPEKISEYGMPRSSAVKARLTPATSIAELHSSGLRTLLSRPVIVNQFFTLRCYFHGNGWRKL